MTQVTLQSSAVSDFCVGGEYGISLDDDICYDEMAEDAG
jgi:hypothetical protein